VPADVAETYLTKASTSGTYNAFIHTHADYVSTHVEAFSQLSLAGAPIAVKDNFLTK